MLLLRNIKWTNTNFRNYICVEDSYSMCEDSIVKTSSPVAVIAVGKLGSGTVSTFLREFVRRDCERPRARGGWLCMPFTATTLVPSMWMRALQLVFFDVHRQITLSLNFDSSQNGNVFTIMIIFPRRDLRNLMPARKEHCQTTADKTRI